MPSRSPLRLAPLSLAVLTCLLLVPFATASDHWDYEESHSDSRDFVAGGMLHVTMSVGDLRIRRGDGNQLRLHYTVKAKRESAVKNAQVDFKVQGTNATLEFRGHGRNTAFEVELEIPQNTNLDVHQSVGDMTVEEIEGDKDLKLSVGDIRVERDRSTYRRVDASTSIGDVNSDLDVHTSGWLGKTLSYHGDGKYELRAHVGVGDIRLEGK